MLKNALNQKWRVFAFTRSTAEPVTGDAAQITCKVSSDFGAASALADVNPTESEDGYYYFDLTQGETNYDSLEIYPDSSTAGVQVIGVPALLSPIADLSGLSGPYTQTITIDDGVDPVSGATVRISRAGETETAITDGSGQVVFTVVADPNWEVSIVAVGFAGETNALPVTGDASAVYSLTALSIPVPTDPTLTTMYVKCVDEDGVIEVGAVVTAVMIAVPAGSEGYAFDDTRISEVSGGDGMVYVPLVKGATYKVRRANGTRPQTIVAADTDNFQAPSFIGNP